MSYLDEIFSLVGKTAVVIGGGGVLAGQVAEGLALAGARIVLFDKNESNARARMEKIQQQKGEAMVIMGDATVKSDLQRALLRILQTYPHLDILVNAPGINSTTTFFDITEDEWDAIQQVNLKSIFLSCQIFGRQMIAQGQGGSIINFSSVASQLPHSRTCSYNVSKAGVNNLTQYLAREWASHAIRVNALLPGFFPAEQNRKIFSPERIADIMRHTPMNRFGESDELVAACIWLAAPRASSFVTGAFIQIDGGFSAMTI
ncbi:SDR family oxidoreductase [candidate division KSB1 bacterium]|nr:SDR family oxidoreductase [candidate division KSB1 bacterium]